MIRWADAVDQRKKRKNSVIKTQRPILVPTRPPNIPERASSKQFQPGRPFESEQTYDPLPQQMKPQNEEDRVYPRPILQKKWGGYGVIKNSVQRARAYTDRAPVLAEGESIDPTSTTNVSPLPTSTGRSRELSRSNASREPSLSPDIRDRILAFREHARPRLDPDWTLSARPKIGRSRAYTLCRSKANNRKRTNSHFQANQEKERGQTFSGLSAGLCGQTASNCGSNTAGHLQASLPRDEATHLMKLDTASAISVQVRSAWTQGEPVSGVATPESS